VTDKIIYRSAQFEGVEGRTIHGLAVPYNDRALIHDWDYTAKRELTYYEEFRLGSFARSISERAHKVRLMVQHDHRRLPIGRASELREEPDGLHASFDVARTSDGDDVLELVREGVVDSFSIGFRPIRERWENDNKLRIHLEASLSEVSVVANPAYEGAKIAGVRGQVPVISRAAAERRLRLLDLER
jgi:HK97 family phage prohead protease